MTQQKTDATSDKDTGQEGGFVSDYLLYLLAAASDVASAQFHAQVRKAGLRVPEWRVLACLSDTDGAMITQLARQALAEQSRLTRIIAQMEERGLLIRRSDPADGRRVRVYLTDAGRALAAELVPQARRHEAALIEMLKGNEGAQLKPALKSLLAALDDTADQRG
ncbi:MAG: MarR family transcriptional regulator [Sulfitobacter sp.]|uniref:MarR family winged helix-turn-helix transcriptional regulator n=1 Tax=Sulfitobacter TaxID=60136 RepID=UPI000E7739E3|nr:MULTISPECIES: MarR family transcriptional regulator [Sulfitobacter]AYE87842.1 MarR family transcriptional regulator [Sulfitobacter sp. D7]UWR39250.1 MarR family transcriptional regulator [Sulfitobacter sp. W074]